MRILRVLLALGAIGAVAACSSDEEVVGVGQETLTGSMFGYTTIGGSWGTFGSGIKAVNRFALAEAGSVSKLSIYVDGNGGSTGTGVMKGVVYADAGGQPGALLATSSEISVASGAAAGWKDLSFSSPVSLSAGSYFVGVLVGGTANVIRETYDVQTGMMRYDADAYADGASNPYGTATTYNNKMSLYATYTATPKTFGNTTVGASWGIFGSGINLVYGNSSPRYPAGLWGGTAAQIDSIQMIWNSPSDQTRRIVTDNSVPAGVSKQVLESAFVNPYRSPTQDNFQFYPDTRAPEGMVYFSKWMWLQPDLASRGPFWAEFHETKTNGASTGGGGNPERFIVGLNLASWTNNQPVWSVSHDGWVNGAYKMYAQSFLSPSAASMTSGQTNAAPVPLGQWFRIETAWNRSTNGTGWVWVALTVPGSSDPSLQRGVQVFAQSGAFNFRWNGVTQSVGWNKATNDPIDRVFPFGAYSDLARSPTNPYSMRQTNIETWTTWPSTATAHPAAFR